MKIEDLFSAYCEMTGIEMPVEVRQLEYLSKEALEDIRRYIKSDFDSEIIKDLKAAWLWDEENEEDGGEESCNTTLIQT